MHCHCYAVCYEIKVYVLKYSIHIVLFKKNSFKCEVYDLLHFLLILHTEACTVEKTSCDLWWEEWDF